MFSSEQARPKTDIQQDFLLLPAHKMALMLILRITRRLNTHNRLRNVEKSKIIFVVRAMK